MIDPELVPEIAIAQRLVESKHWKWMPGMLIKDYGPGIRFFWSDDNWFHGIAAEGNSWIRIKPSNCFPDLNDAATLGCLLQLVRMAWKDPEAHLGLGGSGWVLLSGESRVADVVYPVPAGNTESECLVSALLLVTD